MKMALKFKLSLFPALACVIACTTLRAQEGNFSAQELQELKQQPQNSELLNLEEDKPLLMEADTKVTKTNTPSSSNKENAANGTVPHAAKPKTDSNKTTVKEKGEEDPLNFNFLYFIIQRFKISDIVDD
jgi:hypothetical protein